MTAAAGPAGRLPCAARLGLARRNSLRARCALRSDRAPREWIGRALRALPAQGCAARRRRHRRRRASPVALGCRVPFGHRWLLGQQRVW